jgi:hypothetical protein
LHVDVHTSWHKDPELCVGPISTPYAAVGAALPKLSNLKSFRLMGDDPALKQIILGPLHSFSQLTRLEVNPATVSFLGALPPSVQDLKLTLQANGFVRLATKAGRHFTCPPLESHTALRALNIRVNDIGPSVAHPMMPRTVGLALSLPPSLTSLYVSGPVSDLAYPAGLPLLQVFKAVTGTSMQPESFAFHVSRMPRLREVAIQGWYMTEYDMEDIMLTWAQARGLAAVLASATDLTSLTLDGFGVEWGGIDVMWGSTLQQLTGLKSLTLGVGPSDIDVLPLVRLSQLTSLSLGGGGNRGGDVSDGPLCTLLEALTGVQELTIENSSSLRSCAVLFGAVMQLTGLRKLVLDRNMDLVCELEAFVQLTHLTHLTELMLSHATSETVTEADAAAFREFMPQLVNFSCRTCSTPEPVIVASSWAEMNGVVAVDEMDIEE